MSSVDEKVKKFISDVSKKYNIKESELTDMWKTKEKDQFLSNNDLMSTLSKLNKKELGELCKSNKLKVSGTKDEVINRLIEHERNKNNYVPPVTSSKKTSPSVKPVIKKLEAKIPAVTIVRNSHGNYEHKDTSFVFNNKTQKVIGKQNSDGSVCDLTTEDINICHKYKFPYIIPENLNKTKGNNKKNEDEDDDEEDDIEIEEEEEEEEEAEEEVEDDEDEFEYYEE